MHKDTKEALARLEEALLVEETPELDDEDLDVLLEEFLEEDEEFTDHPAGYQNFANGYRAYNSDESDEDLDVYSDAVLEEPEAVSLPLRITLVTALAVAVGSLAYILVRCLL